eukprot:6202975-Amphidinium_carterae.2
MVNSPPPKLYVPGMWSTPQGCAAQSRLGAKAPPEPPWACLRYDALPRPSANPARSVPIPHHLLWAPTHELGPARGTHPA